MRLFELLCMRLHREVWQQPGLNGFAVVCWQLVDWFTLRLGLLCAAHVKPVCDSMSNRIVVMAAVSCV